VTIFLHSIGYGLITGGLLAVASVGLTLQFGITNYPNLSYCQYMTLGALLTWELASKMSLWPAALVASLCVGVVSVFIGKQLLGRYTRRGASNIHHVLASFALAFLFSGLMTAEWGTGIYQYSIRTQRPHHIGPFLFTNIELGILLLAGLSMTGLHVLLRYTILGKSMRAMSDNPTLARLCGVPTSRITTAVWFISGVLASLGGVALALSFGVFDVQMGLSFLFVVLAAIVVGGIGRPYGTMLGALIIGMSIEVSTNVISAGYKLDVAFAVLIISLLLRPQGISGVRGHV